MGLLTQRTGYSDGNWRKKGKTSSLPIFAILGSFPKFTQRTYTLAALSERRIARSYPLPTSHLPLKRRTTSTTSTLNIDPPPSLSPNPPIIVCMKVL